MMLYAPQPTLLSMPTLPTSPQNVDSTGLGLIDHTRDIAAVQRVLQVVGQNNMSPTMLAQKAALEMQLAQSLASSANATQSLLALAQMQQSQASTGLSALGAMQNAQSASPAMLLHALNGNNATNSLAAALSPSLSGATLSTLSAVQDFASPFSALSSRGLLSSPMRTGSADSIASTILPSAPSSFSEQLDLSRASTIPSSHICSPIDFDVEVGAKRKFSGDEQDAKMPRMDATMWALPNGFAPGAAPSRKEGASGQCVHGRQRSRCKDCGGSGICEHNKRRSMCKQCGGSQICEHGRQRSQCKDCGGASICEHNCLRSRCKDCGGASICEHKKRWRQCKICSKSEVCVHKRRKPLCKECSHL